MRDELQSIQDLPCCARCGKIHVGLTFKKLTNPIYCNPFEVMTHWAMCPELEQPVLMGTRDPSAFGREFTDR